MTEQDHDSPNSNLGPSEHDAAVPLRVILKISLTAYDAVSTGNQLPLFRISLLPPTSNWTILNAGGGGSPKRR